MSDRDPSTQFQIGEPVLFVSAGVLTTVSGYVWAECVSGLPDIMAYKLACGCIVPEKAIRKQAFSASASKESV